LANSDFVICRVPLRTCSFIRLASPSVPFGKTFTSYLPPVSDLSWSPK
jgi:hypothetical protein